MVEKYYEGIIEQVYGRIGGHAGNMTLARYSNDTAARQRPEVRVRLVL